MKIGKLLILEISQFWWWSGCTGILKLYGNLDWHERSEDCL